MNVLRGALTGQESYEASLIPPSKLKPLAPSKLSWRIFSEYATILCDKKVSLRSAGDRELITDPGAGRISVG